MTTYTNRPHETTDFEATPHEAQPQRTSPVLLAALAVALVAAGVWWASQREEARSSVASTPVVVEAVPDATQATAPAQAGTEARVATAKRQVHAARPVLADRSARPLAGNPMPEYPRAALRNGAEGSVMLSMQVDARGVPTEVQVVERSGDRDRDFDRAAMEAARQWRFEPAVRDGKAVSSTVRLPVDFRRG